MKITFQILILLFVVNRGNSQTLIAKYHVEKEVRGLPEGVSMKALSLLCYYYQKDNKVITYLKPDYLEQHPNGIRIESKNLTIGIDLDSIQYPYFYDFDSMIVKYRFKKMEDEYELIYRGFDTNFRKWHRRDGSYLINGMKCKHAIYYRMGSTTPEMEIWYVEDVEMPVGPVNLINVPGLIVKARIYGNGLTLKLDSFTTQAEIDDSVFQLKELNGTFIKKSDFTN